MSREDGALIRSKKLPRRDFLRMACFSAAGAVLASCVPGPVEPVVQIVAKEALTNELAFLPGEELANLNGGIRTLDLDSTLIQVGDVYKPEQLKFTGRLIKGSLDPEIIQAYHHQITGKPEVELNLLEVETLGGKKLWVHQDVTNASPTRFIDVEVVDLSPSWSEIALTQKDSLPTLIAQQVRRFEGTPGNFKLEPGGQIKVLAELSTNGQIIIAPMNNNGNYILGKDGLPITAYAPRGMISSEDRSTFHTGLRHGFAAEASGYPFIYPENGEALRAYELIDVGQRNFDIDSFSIEVIGEPLFLSSAHNETIITRVRLDDSGSETIWFIFRRKDSTILGHWASVVDTGVGGNSFQGGVTTGDVVGSAKLLKNLIDDGGKNLENFKFIQPDGSKVDVDPVQFESLKLVLQNLDEADDAVAIQALRQQTDLDLEGLTLFKKIFGRYAGKGILFAANFVDVAEWAAQAWGSFRACAGGLVDCAIKSAYCAQNFAGALTERERDVLENFIKYTWTTEVMTGTLPRQKYFNEPIFLTIAGPSFCGCWTVSDKFVFNRPNQDSLFVQATPAGKVDYNTGDGWHELDAHQSVAIPKSSVDEPVKVGIRIYGEDGNEIAFEIWQDGSRFYTQAISTMMAEDPVGYVKDPQLKVELQTLTELSQSV